MAGLRRQACRRGRPSSRLRCGCLRRRRPPAPLPLCSLLNLPHTLSLFCLQDLPSRPRRNRRSETFRSSIRECIVSPANFILPIFVHEEGSGNVPIPSMPGIFRLAYGKNVIDYVAEARSYGVNQVVVFPKVRPQRRPRAGPPPPSYGFPCNTKRSYPRILHVVGCCGRVGRADARPSEDANR